MKKKKIYICIGTLVVFVLVSFVLLTHTNLTKSWAFATAEKNSMKSILTGERWLSLM